MAPEPVPAEAAPTRWLRPAAGAALAVATAVLAFVEMFREFVPYDDQGWVMLKIQLYLRGEPLYDVLFTPYGPFYYLVRGLLHGVLRVPLTHDAIGLMGVVLWLATAALIALAVGRGTGRRWLAALAYVLAVLHLRPITTEPGHPQDLCGLMMGLILLGAGASGRRGLAARAVGWGVLGACLTLTKINLGAFLTAALLIELGLDAGPGRLATAAKWAVALAMLALPPVIALVQQPVDWALSYAATASLALLGVLLVARPSAERSPPWAPAAFLLAFAATAGLVAAATLALGTTVEGLFRGLFEYPRRIALGYVIPTATTPRGVAWALACVALAALHAGLSRRGTIGRLHATALALAKLVFGLVVVAAALARTLGVMFDLESPRPDVPELSAFGVLLNVAAPLLWLAAAGPAGHDRRRRAPALMAASMLFAAFPVAGSQQAFATLLMVPAGLFALGDALAALASGAPPRLRRLGAGAVVAALLVGCVGLDALAVSAYRGSVPLGMPGARLYRTEERFGALIRWLVGSLKAEADIFWCTKSFNSLYFWTGEPPPAPIATWNGTTFLSLAQQARVAEGLRASPRTCVVVLPGFLGGMDIPKPWESPLLGLVAGGYGTWARAGFAELQLPLGRPAPEPIDCLYRPRWRPGPRSRDRLAVRLSAATGPAIARLVVRDLDARRDLADSAPPSGEPTLQILDESSRPLPPGAPIERDRVRSLTLLPAVPIPPGDCGFLGIRLFGRDGRLLATLPYAEVFLPPGQPPTRPGTIGPRPPCP